MSSGDRRAIELFYGSITCPEVNFNGLSKEIEEELFQNGYLIDKLTDRRDKPYAHRDNIDLPQMTLMEIQELISLKEKIYEHISLVVIGEMGSVTEEDVKTWKKH